MSPGTWSPVGGAVGAISETRPYWGKQALRCQSIAQLPVVSLLLGVAQNLRPQLAPLAAKPAAYCFCPAILEANPSES